MKEFVSIIGFNKYKVLSTISIFCCLNFSCQEKSPITEYTYRYFQPKYNGVGLLAEADSLTFPLNDSTYKEIKSFNYFESDGIDYISFFDQRSASINIFDIKSQKLVKRILIKNCIPGRKLYKTSVYTKNFDSLFINNLTTLYLIDKAGAIKKSIDFLDKPDFAWAFFENTNQPVLKENMLYACVRPYVNETSLKALKEWKVLYSFDLNNNKASLHCHLPADYQNNLYGLSFLNYNYCFNNNGKFVFSFPADYKIYETNLNDFHIAYFGKSSFQKDSILPMSREDLLKDNGSKANMKRDMYGPVYFDPYRKRYLRICRQKTNTGADEGDKRKQSIIVFNEDLKIIGESEMSSDVSLNSIFITNDGKIYARTNTKDENALHFIRMSYNDDKLSAHSQLVKK